MILSADAFASFLTACASQSVGDFDQVIAPYATEEEAFVWLPYKDRPVLDSFRTIDPLKLLMYWPREQVLPAEAQIPKRLIVGAKACDIRALQVLDQALLYDAFEDPLYRQWRERTVIIGTDCRQAAPTCHCTLVGGSPHPQEGYDLNIGRIDDHYMIEVGSEKGEALLQLMQQQISMENATADQKATLEKMRDAMIERVRDQNREYERPETFSELKSLDIKEWAEPSQTCIGCGACTHICPTCYCLILDDESHDSHFIKKRSYDSCQLNGYARVAGGSTPRPHMRERFRNRYLCKLYYIKDNFDVMGCTGCGRCTETCAGEIDFRQVVQQMMSKTKAPA